MKTKLTYREAFQEAFSFLENNDLEGYAAEVFLLERQGWSKTDFVLHLDQLIPNEVNQQFESDIKAYKNGLPLQHILGYEWFFERKFKVTKDTLIPRPETEAIVAEFLSINQKREKLKVLDVGTGTGAIAITIKKERPEDSVTATDISAAALQIAKENATSLKADVDFLLGDLLEPVVGEKFDVVVSNPPYISEAELPLVDEVVLANEPHIALFAEHNGLAIYQRLAKELPAVMLPAGQIILEIGFQQGEAVKALFEAAFPYGNIQVKKDLAGLERLVYIQLP